MITTEHHDRRFDPVSLVGGIVVLFIAGAFALVDLDSFGSQARLLWPTVLVGIGLSLLLDARSRRS